MRPYELMAVYPIEEDQFQDGKERMQQDLAAHNVEVVTAGEPVERDLAYEVQKKHRARYVLYNIKADPAQIQALNRSFRLNSNLLKYLFVRVDEKESQ
jgi:small subunit ribosomal protein S6